MADSPSNLRSADQEGVPSPSGDRNDDLATPDKLASFDGARRTGTGTLYDADEASSTEADPDREAVIDGYHAPTTFPSDVDDAERSGPAMSSGTVARDIAEEDAAADAS